jgi:hypothetical protein
MNKYLVLGFLFTILTNNLSNCLESLYRAYLPKNSVKFFNKLMIDEPQFDLWLSTRLVKNDVNNYFAEFRVKNESVLNKYKTKFEQNSIQLQLLVNDLYK